MSEPYNPHVGDVGTVIRLRVTELPPGATVPAAVDLSAATGLQFVLLSPKKRRLVVASVLSGDGTDGKLQYVTHAGDLDAAGQWKVQAKFSVGGSSWSTDVVAFKVSANL
jgi:hypothetical protein